MKMHLNLIMKKVWFLALLVGEHFYKIDLRCIKNHVIREVPMYQNKQQMNSLPLQAEYQNLKHWCVIFVDENLVQLVLRFI